jgi:hypothetical protein
MIATWKKSKAGQRKIATIRNAVALLAPIISETYFMELACCFERLPQREDILMGRDFDR